jgi:hypothetical protein
MKISSANTKLGTKQIESDRTKLLSAPASGNVQQLTELSRLYEKKLITRDEYEKAKKEIFREERT